MSAPRLTVRALRTQAVEAPMSCALGTRGNGLAWDAHAVARYRLP